MFELLRHWVLRALRVPPEPEPPFGDPASTRVFRASQRYYSLRLLGWGMGECGALVALIAGFAIMFVIDQRVMQLREHQLNESPPPAQQDTDGNKPKFVLKHHGKEGLNELINELATHLVKIPRGWFVLVWVLKIFGVLFYIFQFFVSYAVLRIDYEMRWYMVTDRSLRIRTGVWKVQELTMSFANLQQVVLSQGPIQRLLSIADVRVQSAGGGAMPTHGHHQRKESLHTGFFHGVDNAVEVRDLILARLRHFQETGLGHPDEVHRPMPVSATPNPHQATVDMDAISAARELLAETRQVRTTLVG